jgi:hypothetical protein
VVLNFVPRKNQKLRTMQSEERSLSAKGPPPSEEEKAEGSCFNLNANESVLKADKKSFDIEECFIKVKERKKKTDVSFSMKRIDKNKLCEMNNFDNPSNKPISSFTCRADVIYKKVLRDFRRYFVNQFANFTQIVDLTSVRKKRERENLLMDFVNSKFSVDLERKSEVAYCLGTLLSPKAVSRNFFELRKPKKDVFKIHDTLYKFSIKKVEDLTGDFAACILFDRFLSVDENVERIMQCPKVSSNSYEQAIDLLRARISKTLGK